jgi:hypothetical protein
MNSQFKFKPDKIKYLSNVDTLDSSHKKIIDVINKKRDDVPKKVEILNELKQELENLENGRNEFTNIPNFINIRAKLIENISTIEEELFQIEHYEEETEYYSKTYQILFNYYDILDGQIENELKIKLNIDNSTIDSKNDFFNQESDKNNILPQDDDIYDHDESINIQSDNYSEKHNNQSNQPNQPNQSNQSNQPNQPNQSNQSNQPNQSNQVKQNVENTDAWNFDGVEIFNSFKSSKLDKLNEMSKMKRKEKKTTRKRVKNVESLIKDNNYNIFDFIHSNIKNDDTTKNIVKDTTIKCNNYDIYDRAILYEDYKTSLEGYAFKKNNSKPCINCGVDKVLIYSEGIYACLKCGEVENCIVESEVTNYKDPMVEKPTFPYKRKNHFCEWIIFALLVKVIIKNNGYSSLLNL